MGDISILIFEILFVDTSQAMVDSWSVPFGEAFSNSEKVQLYEVLELHCLLQRLVHFFILLPGHSFKPKEEAPY